MLHTSCNNLHRGTYYALFKFVVIIIIIPPLHLESWAKVWAMRVRARINAHAKHANTNTHTERERDIHSIIIINTHSHIRSLSRELFSSTNVIKVMCRSRKQNYLYDVCISNSIFINAISGSIYYGWYTDTHAHTKSSSGS